jgi:hypothetical protein
MHGSYGRTRAEAQGPTVRRSRILRPIVPPPRDTEKQFQIRVERAVSLIARSGCTTRHACRCVGLKVGTTSETTVKLICDERPIPRWRASSRCRGILQISLPLAPLVRPRRPFATATHVPSPAFVDSPARQQAARERRRRLKEATYRRVNRWRARNPERQAPLSAVATAIQNSDLVREPCERCGTTKHVCADPISLHPLRVKWCCRSCGVEQRRLARSNTEEARR